LLARGESVRVLDNFSTGLRSNLSDVKTKIDLLEGDIRNYYNVAEAVEGIEYVIHLAALPRVPRSVKDPLTSNTVNVDGTMNVLEASHRAKIKRLVFASSSSIYGEGAETDKIESMIPNPVSPYGVSKLAGEKYCQVYTRLYGLETVSLRFFNVFGGNEDPDSPYSTVVPIFTRFLARGDRPTIFGDGSISRDYTYISNVLSAIIASVTAPNASGEVINVGCGKTYSLKHVVEEINKLLGTKLEPKYSTVRAGDVNFTLADISKAQRLLGYKVLVDFYEGLEKTVKFIMDTGK